MKDTETVEPGRYDYDLTVSFPSVYIPDHTPPRLRATAKLRDHAHPPLLGPVRSGGASRPQRPPRRPRAQELRRSGWPDRSDHQLHSHPRLICGSTFRRD
ncbi:hypothetical protein LUW77_03380 [Streptomyces radiopugnans]|nr:hypothetical protein LUW77_03380 [Streptomyces radiopugnans]